MAKADASLPKPARTPRHDRRREAIIACARKAFLRGGYGHTTMSGIADALGGSKSTLWSHFRSKEELFAAVIDDRIERYGEALRVPLPANGELRATLEAIAKAILVTVCRPDLVALQRLVAGEAARFPKLGKMMIERGMKRGQARIAEWLAAQMERGRLRRVDTLIAAQHFTALVQAGPYQYHLLGAGPRPNAAQMTASSSLATEIFLRAYAA